MLNPDCGNGKLMGEPAGIYVCGTSILKYIPKAGHFDIKEGLIPENLLDLTPAVLLTIIAL